MTPNTRSLCLPALAVLALSGCVVAQPVTPGIYVEEPYAYETLPPDYYGHLGGYGVWRTVPAYGTVWCPQVGSVWSPYYYGPAAPWGFTFYFGDWISTPYGWGWIPGHTHHSHWHRWAHRGHRHRHDGGGGRHHAKRRTYERRRYDGTPHFDSRGRDRRERKHDGGRDVRRGGNRDGRVLRPPEPRRTVERERPSRPGRRVERHEPRRPDRRRQPRGGRGFRPPGVPIAATPGSRGGWRSRPLGGREVRNASPRAGTPTRRMRPRSARSSPRRGVAPRRAAMRGAASISGGRSVRGGGRSVRGGGRSVRGGGRSVRGGGHRAASGGRGQQHGHR